jgi:cysteine desulfurase
MSSGCDADELVVWVKSSAIPLSRFPFNRTPVSPRINPMIYLDNNATTQPDSAVRDAMLPFLSNHYGNPSSTHRFGQESRQAIEEARVQIARLVGCETREIIFTSGGTESDNAAVMGLLAARAPRKLIVSSAVEHSAIREPLTSLAKTGFEIQRISVNQQGELAIDQLEQILASRGGETALVTIMWANNETGVLFDISAIGALCRKQGVPFHVDAVQAVGKVPVNLRGVPIDLMSISAHKFHGPKGAGALVVRRGTRWQPWIRGGPQELDRRGGTENVPGVVGMGRAAQLAASALADDATWPRVTAMRDRLEAGILEKVSDTHLIGTPNARVPNTANIAFAGLEAEAILLLLSEHDICASAGAACSSGSLEPSPILRAMGVDDKIGHGAVRFSLSRFNTDAEIAETLDILPRIIARLRQTLPV